MEIIVASFDSEDFALDANSEKILINNNGLVHALKLDENERQDKLVAVIESINEEQA